MIPCPKCKKDLPEKPFLDHWVVCLHCGHRWELNDDNTAVKSVTIKIENITKQISASMLLRGK